MLAAAHPPVDSEGELHLRLEQQRAVALFGQLALGNTSLDDLLAAAVEAAAAGLRTDFACLLECLPKENVFALRATAGHAPKAYGRHVDASPTGSQAGYTLATGEPVVMLDSSTEKRFSLPPQVEDLGFASGISVRVGQNGRPFGVLIAHTRGFQSFSSDDIAFLQSISNMVESSLRRRSAEAAMESSNRVLEAIVEGTTDSIFVKDLEGRFVVVNAAAAARIGLPKEELLGRSLEEVLPHDSAAVMAQSDRLVLERGKVETFEEVVPFDWGTRTYLATKGPYRGSDGTLSGTFGIARDITERNEAQQELRRATAYAERLIETANSIVIVLDIDGTILTFNHAAEEITGFGRDEVVGRNWDVLLPRDRYPEVWEEFDRLVVEGAPDRYENPILTKNGEERFILWQNSRLRDDEGNVVATVSFGIDQTEAVRAQNRADDLERQLGQAEKLEALGRLAGGVAHDFNNLLLALRGHGELALASMEPGADAAADVRAMLDAADHATELTRQLLAFGRRQVLIPEEVDLNAVVRETVSMLERLLGETVEVAIELCPDPLVLRGDRAQLGRVITNLLVNARDAMPLGGRIEVSTLRRGASAQLVVSDHGVGMDAETSARLFEPFFSTKGELGNGLGLATVYGIVSQSGGEITFDTQPDVGTTFTVTLPLRTGRRNRVAAPAVNDTAGKGGERILVVEDDSRVRSIVTAMLELSGYDVLSAESGTEGIELAKQDPGIDLVLTDLVMRGMDGRETIERIRAERPNLRVLYMSGYAGDADSLDFPLGEGSDFIQKPFSGEALAAKVRAVLDEPSVAA